MTPVENPWHENEGFWKDNPFPGKMVKRAQKEVNKLVELADLDEGLKVLDLCCGVGRHSLEFAERGFDVTGVDKTEHYLKEARKRAGEEGLEIEFIQDDMREYKKDEKFDLVINLFTSFGYFEEEKENMKVLENVYDSLKTGGKFILDVMGKEIIARIFEEKDWNELEDGFKILERSIEKDWSWLNNRRIRITDEGVKEYNVSHWLYSAKELKDMLKDVGFSSVEVYGGYDGRDYDEEANRLVVVGKK
ncbi:MAG: methyltransferase domain-containing protein [Candidatus Saliniplasma sp.]